MDDYLSELHSKTDATPSATPAKRVKVCVRACMCVHTLSVYMHVCIHTCMCVSVCVLAYAGVCTCKCTPVCVCMYQCL